MAGARVSSIDALVEFRASLATFLERAQAAVGSLRQEAQRTLLWLEQEQPRYWSEEVRRSFDRVAAARTAYETCRLRTVAGHRPACIEEQQALRKAQRRLAYCQEQQDVVRRWSQKARDQADEFFGKIGPLERTLDRDLPSMIAAMERMVGSIEAYAAVAGSTEGQLVAPRDSIPGRDSSAAESVAVDRPVESREDISTEEAGR
jgi:hypothetical protein